MNLPPLKAVLLLMFGVFLSQGAHCQIDTNNSSSQEADTSLQYVQPSTEKADLNMIIPPSGFVVSDAFNGYLNISISTAIIMTQINNATYLQICDGMTNDFYDSNQLTYISDTSFVSDNGVKGHYYKLSFELDGNELIRYMVYAGDFEKTLWLNITFPKLLEELVEEEIIKSIQSITLNPETNEE